MSLVPGTPQYGYSFVNNLLGYSMDVDTFNAMVAIAQLSRELARDWMVLRAKDTSQVWNPGDTFLTGKTVPANFLKYVEKDPVKLVDSITNPQKISYVSEIPFEKQVEFKDDPGSFYVDYGANLVYICGVQAQQYTIMQFFQKKPPDVFYDATGVANVSWAYFPTWASNVLWYDVAAMQRLGVDYDNVNARMGDENAQRAEIIFASMVKWDARLAKGSVKNMDVLPQGDPLFTSRRIDIYGE